MLTRSFFPCLAALLLLAGAGDLFAQHTLRFRAEEGEQFTYTATVRIRMTGGMDMTMDIETAYGFTCNSSAAPYDFEVEILREKVDMKMKIPMMGEMSGAVDSEGDAPPLPENPMDFKAAIPYGLYVKTRAKAGQTVALSVSDRGELMKIRGLRRLFEKVEEAVADDENIHPMMRAGLTRDLKPASFRRNLASLFLRLPDKPVKPDDSWSRTFDEVQDDNAELALEETVTLLKAEDGFGDYAAKVRLQEEEQEIHPESQSPMMKVISAVVKRYDGNEEGLVDLANGRILFSARSLEQVTVQETENPMNRQVRKTKVTFKIEAEIEHAPGIVRERAEEEDGE